MWLWIPVCFFCFQIILELTLPPNLLASVHTENGLHEVLQAIVLMAAFIISLLCLYQLRGHQKPFLTAWVGLAALCCFYVGGEEISWGQHIFDWTSSDFWQQVNDQNETNLHNTSSWLDQKPRLILLVGVILGGLMIPVSRKFNFSFAPVRFEIIYPSWRLSLTAMFVLLITFLDKVEEAIDSLSIFERASEIQELYMFYFVMLYMIELYTRFKLNLIKPTH